MTNNLSGYSVRPITVNIGKDFILKKHYAHRMPMVQYAFGLFNPAGVLVGVCTFGIPANYNLMTCCGDEYKDRVIELNRLIKNDGLPANAQTWFAARAINFLTKPKIIISYADPNHGHSGITYQALNFIYTGLSGEVPVFEKGGVAVHQRHVNEHIRENMTVTKTKTFRQMWVDGGGTISMDSGKHRYILFVGAKHERKKMRRALKYQTHPYPKTTNTRYDTSQKIITQVSLDI